MNCYHPPIVSSTPYHPSILFPVGLHPVFPISIIIPIPLFHFFKIKVFSNHLTAYTVKYYVTQQAGITGNTSDLRRYSEYQLVLLLSCLLFSAFPQFLQENAKTNDILTCPFQFFIHQSSYLHCCIV